MKKNIICSIKLLFENATSKQISVVYQCSEEKNGIIDDDIVAIGEIEYFWFVFKIS